MQIRMSSHEDLDEIAQMVYESYQKAYRQYAMHELADMTTINAVFEEILLPPEHMWVAYVDMKIVGMIAFHKNTVERLFIKITHQQKGIGKKLLTHALNIIKAQGHHQAYLEVVEENKFSQAFFQRQGAVLDKTYVCTLRNKITVRMLRFYLQLIRDE